MPLYCITLVLGVMVERRSPRSLCPHRLAPLPPTKPLPPVRGSPCTPTTAGRRRLCRHSNDVRPPPFFTTVSQPRRRLLPLLPVVGSSRLVSLHLLLVRPLLRRFLSPLTTANFVFVFTCFAGSCGTVYHAHWYGSVCTFCVVNLNGTSFLS
jgi:hypothetical protein